MLFVGDDWAEDHHDVYLMNDTGDRLASGRLSEGLAGIGRLHELIAEHAEDPAQVVIGIETDRGLWVDALTAAGYRVFAVNPLAAARYRDRHHVSGAKSDLLTELPQAVGGGCVPGAVGLARFAAHDGRRRTAAGFGGAGGAGSGCVGGHRRPVSAVSAG